LFYCSVRSWISINLKTIGGGVLFQSIATISDRPPTSLQTDQVDVELDQNTELDQSTLRTTSTTTSPTSSSTSTAFRRQKRLTEETVSPFLRRMNYAVRGSVVIAADKINDELTNQRGTTNNNNNNKYPFDKITYTNIGNPQALGQKPLTWPRQVMALVDLPNEVGIDHPDASKLFPVDAIQRAREIKEKGLSGYGSGAYSHSKGVKMFREDVCAFLQERDGQQVPTDPEDIFLSNGASAAIVSIRWSWSDMPILSIRFLM
jgi:DNA-binding transcriptional MocR family regulator